MNKNDLINNVADAAGISKTVAASAVDSVFDSISSALSGGGDVRLVGFGTFSVANRKATTGRNPRTGEVIQIKASKSPKFKAGKALKDAVNWNNLIQFFFKPNYVQHKKLHVFFIQPSILFLDFLFVLLYVLFIVMGG